MRAQGGLAEAAAKGHCGLAAYTWHGAHLVKKAVQKCKSFVKVNVATTRYRFYRITLLADCLYDVMLEVSAFHSRPGAQEATGESISCELPGGGTVVSTVGASMITNPIVTYCSYSHGISCT